MALIDQLVERYQYRLVRYLVYLTARPESVEDLVQETWLRVLDRGGQYDGRSRFEAWLFSIARNLAIDDLRKRPVVSLDAPDAAGPARAVERQAPDRSSPFLAAARSEDAVRLAAALSLLEPIYREALLLRFQEDLSLQEVSQIVGAPVPTVSSRIHRGLGLLRSRWKEAPMQSDPHQRARFLIDEALIAGIARDDERWLHSHKEECVECANYAELTSRIVRGFSSLSFETDPGTIARVQDAIASHAPRRYTAAPWRWAWIAAALLMVVAAPIYRNMTDKRRAAEMERADTRLLERVEARLSQTLPEAMEPLTPEPAQGGKMR